MVHHTNKRAAAEICYRFSELNIGVKPIEVAEKIEKWRIMMNKQQAKENMENIIRHRHNITPTQYKQAADDTPDITPLGTINNDGITVTVVVTITDLWNVMNNKITQTGLAKDETGKLKFTSFNDDAPTLTKNNEYIIKNAVTSKYNETYEIVINEATTITPLNKTINTNTTTKELEQQHLDDEHAPTTDPINPEITYTATGEPIDTDNTTLGIVTDITITTQDTNDNAYTANITINTTRDETTTVTLPSDLVSDVVGVNATTDNIPRDNVTQTLEDTILTQWVETTLTNTDSNDTLVTALTTNPEIKDEHIDTIADVYTDN